MIRSLKRLLRILGTGSAFLLFFCGGTILAMLILPIVRLRKGTPEEKAARCREYVSDAWVFFHDYMRVLGLINYDSRRLTMPLPEGPLVVVANHPTLVDVTAIISAWGRLVCVAKTMHVKSPLIGRLLRYCGYIQGDDGGLFSAGAVVTKGVEALKRGAAILIFPEGTRSPENGLGRFRQGAFEMAARANAPILPVFVTCDPPTLMRGQAWYEVPERMADLTVTPMALIPPPPDPAQATEALRRAYEERLESFLARRALPRESPAATALQAGWTEASTEETHD